MMTTDIQNDQTRNTRGIYQTINLLMQIHLR